MEKTSGIPLKIKIFIAFAAIYVIWGTTYLAIRFAIETIPPFFMMGCRFLSAGIVLYSLARFRGQANPSLQQWKTAVVIGILLFFGGYGALAWSEQVLPSGVAALIVATTPIWMILLSYFRSPVSKIGRSVILGLALGFLGMVLIVEPTKLLGGQSVDLAGAAVLLFGTISWCFGSVYSKYGSLPKSPFLASGMMMLCGGMALVLVGLLTGEHKALASASFLSLASLFYLVLFGSIIGFTAYIWLLNTVSPAQVSTYAFVNPIIAVFVGWFGGGESLSPRILMATILMVAGVLAIVSRKSEKRHSADKRNSEKAIIFKPQIKGQESQRQSFNTGRRYELPPLDEYHAQEKMS
ncbi:MAG: EamA family transporter [Candidatus Aminicenantes bacterium]|nr:EamA family transporter [Candidatus Aminicenantes bacterium]